MSSITAMVEFERTVVDDIVRAAASRYFASRRHRIDGFVARNFSWRGALRIHRNAFGWDLVRAPVNVFLEPLNFALRMAGRFARQVGAKRLAALADRTLLLETSVAREVAWLVQIELLELPCCQGTRHVQRDALAEEILADPRLVGGIRRRVADCGSVDDNSGLRRRLEQRVSAYTLSRSAVTETTTSLTMLAAGAASLQRLTPGALVLGPNLAAAIAQHAAIAAFPLGAGLGSLWYGLFPATPSPLLLGAVTSGLIATAAAIAPFVGIVADPLQRYLGLHRRRLHRLVDALEREFNAPGAGQYMPRDHYVARLLSLLDLLGGTAQMVLL